VRATATIERKAGYAGQKLRELLAEALDTQIRDARK